MRLLTAIKQYVTTQKRLRQKPAHLIYGRQAENRAHRFLKRQGLKPLSRNYLTRFGEIDLIMLDKNTLVFVEVRAKQKLHPIHPVESVTRAKQQRIIRTAQHFCQHHHWHGNCRFDMVTIVGHQNPHWIPGAFIVQ